MRKNYRVTKIFETKKGIVKPNHIYRLVTAKGNSEYFRNYGYVVEVNRGYGWEHLDHSNNSNKITEKFNIWVANKTVSTSVRRS